MQNKRGFTLIEIVLVLVVLGIVAAVAIAKYWDMEKQAKYEVARASVHIFCAEVNGLAAKKMLAGESCIDALGSMGSIDPSTPKFGKGALGEVSEKYKIEWDANHPSIHPGADRKKGEWLFYDDSKKFQACNKNWAGGNDSGCIGFTYDEIPLMKCNVQP